MGKNKNKSNKIGNSPNKSKKNEAYARYQKQDQASSLELQTVITFECDFIKDEMEPDDDVDGSKG